MTTQDHIENRKQIVEHGGGIWVGYQESFPSDPVPAYVLFQAPLSKNLLMLPDDEFFTTQSVSEKIYRADKTYHEWIQKYEESV